MPCYRKINFRWIKRNTLLGILCILAGIGVLLKQTADMRKQQLEQMQEEQIIEQSESNSETSNSIVQSEPHETQPDKTDGSVLELLSRPVESLAPADDVVYVQPEEKTVTLSNEFIEVEFTTAGGAIKSVHFLQTKKGGRDSYVFNENGIQPALSLSLDGAAGALKAVALPYAIEQQSEYSITFTFDVGNGLRLQRKYVIAEPDSEKGPYTIKHTTAVSNQSDTSRELSRLYVNLGTAHSITENQPQFLNVGYFDGEKARFTAINKLTGHGFLSFLPFFGASEPVDKLEKPVGSEWVSVKNQFFASILSSDIPGRDLVIYNVAMPALESGERSQPGISASVGYDMGLIAAGSTKALDFDFYVGPKEFKRLQVMDNHQDKVMQFGLLGVISKLLLSFMYGIHKFIPNWGWSIVIMTICIKLLFWPLSAKASRSQKRMAKIQEPMKELKEKYRDSPQKFQQEMLKLFREHRINPVAGCLPMLIQMPIFFGLFYMLRSASELRHESFLWVSDLSMPDTLAHVFGFPINLLPLVMGLTMFFQMRIVPVSPTADPMQQKIFKFLPFIFLIFLYNFSSGLVLYWTVQNLLTIIQQKIISRLPDVEEPAPVTVGKAKSGKGRSTRPSRKKR